MEIKLSEREYEAIRRMSVISAEEALNVLKGLPVDSPHNAAALKAVIAAKNLLNAITGALIVVR